MQLKAREVNRRAVEVHDVLERLANAVVRGYDKAKATARVGGRKARYDDINYEFIGGPNDRLRRKHYDKSLRLLWKAEEHSPWLPFRDATTDERALLDMATRSLSEEEKAERARLKMPQYKAFLNREYTGSQKQAIVNILSAIGHGEAYAWLVSADVLQQVQSTGARAALTMQVMEEAKHFVVLRELLGCFDVPIPRQSAWEYLFLERVFKAKGFERFFGMNVLVEGIALSLFGQLSHLPGLEVLRLFHLDESRHTALPANYFHEYPMSAWEKHSPVARARRLQMILPALALIPQLEPDLAELGIDALEFGGSVLRKVTLLAERSGFALPLPRSLLMPALNALFNVYGMATRDGHQFRNLMESESTQGERELATESEIFAFDT